MATQVQRAQAICDALLNAPATPAQIDRLGRALATAEARLAEYEPATAAQKAAFVVAHFRNYALSAVRGVEQGSAVNTAIASTAADVASGFPETP